MNIRLSQINKIVRDIIKESFLGVKGATNKNGEELKNLELAKHMENEGKKPIEIKLATGWERGFDKNWKYEGLDGIFRKVEIRKGLRLEDIWEDEELYNWYPDLRKVEIIIETGKNGDYASSGPNFIRVPKEVFYWTLPQEKIKNNVRFYRMNGEKTMQHEIQHLIQSREGWEQGAPSPNLSYILDEINRIKKNKEYISSMKNFNLQELIVLYKGCKNKEEREYLLEYIRYLKYGYTYDDLISDLDKDIERLENSRKGEEYYNNNGEKEAYQVGKRYGFTNNQRRNTLMNEEIMYHASPSYKKPEEFEKEGIWLSIGEPDMSYGEQVYEYDVNLNSLNIANEKTLFKYIKKDELSWRGSVYDDGDIDWSEVATEPWGNQWYSWLKEDGYDGYRFTYAGEYEYVFIFDSRNAKRLTETINISRKQINKIVRDIIKEVRYIDVRYRDNNKTPYWTDYEDAEKKIMQYVSDAGWSSEIVKRGDGEEISRKLSTG